MGETKGQFESNDGISCVCFDSGSLLASTGWDSRLKVIDCETNSQILDEKFASPLLCCAWNEQKQVLVGGLNYHLSLLDVNSAQQCAIGSHQNSISTIVCNNETNTIITGSWDKTIKLWDSRTMEETRTIELGHKVFAIDTIDSKLVCAMSDLLISVYDLRNLEKTLQDRQSSLKYMTTSVACMPDGKGFAVGTIEGRVGVEFFDAESQKFAFKCHRKTFPDHDMVYPVNTIKYKPQGDLFYTGGGDGTIALWDQKARKRLKILPNFEAPIQSIDVSKDSRYLAIGTCPEISADKENHPGISPLGTVFIRTCDDSR